MPTWLTVVLIVLSLSVFGGYIAYKSDDNTGYFGNVFGVLAFVLFVAIGIIISIVIALTKFLL